MKTAKNTPQPSLKEELHRSPENLCLILGVLSLFFCWVLLLPSILSMIGLITGVFLLRRPGVSKKTLRIGLLTSGAGLLLSLVTLLL